MTRYFAWDGGQIIAEYEAFGANALIWKTSYVYMGGRLLATTSGVNGSETRFHHPDRLGTRLVTDAEGTVVSEQWTLPFGNMQPFTSVYGGESPYQNPALSNPSRKRFTSYDRIKATGLDYAVNRFYSPQQGRFTQVDPIGMGAVSLGNPQSLNLYSYVENDPINRVDPTGRSWASIGATLINLANSLTIRDSVTISAGIGSGILGGGGGGGLDVFLPEDPPWADLMTGGQFSRDLLDSFAYLSTSDMGKLGDAFNLLIDRLKFPTENCLKNVIGPLSTHPGFEMGKFLDYLNKGFNAYDGANTTAPAVGALSKAGNAPDEYIGKTVQQLFTENPNSSFTGAITVGIPGTEILTVFWNPAHIAGSRAPADLADDWFHEGLHGYGRSIFSEDFFDGNLIDLFNLGDDANSDAISKHIYNNCFK